MITCSPSGSEDAHSKMTGPFLSTLCDGSYFPGFAIVGAHIHSWNNMSAAAHRITFNDKIFVADDLTWSGRSDHNLPAHLTECRNASRQFRHFHAKGIADKHDFENNFSDGWSSRVTRVESHFALMPRPNVSWCQWTHRKSMCGFEVVFRSFSYASNTSPLIALSIGMEAKSHIFIATNDIFRTRKIPQIIHFPKRRHRSEYPGEAPLQTVTNCTLRPRHFAGTGAYSINCVRRLPAHYGVAITVRLGYLFLMVSRSSVISFHESVNDQLIGVRIDVRNITVIAYIK